MENSHTGDLERPFGWALILREDQEFKHEPTTTPINTTENVFLDTPLDKLGELVVSRIKNESEKEDNEHLEDWSKETFAVLDEQSAQDDSVIIATYYTPFRGAENWDKPIPPARWGSVRVKFERAGDTTCSIEMNPHCFLDEDLLKKSRFDNGVLIW